MDALPILWDVGSPPQDLWDREKFPNMTDQLQKWVRHLVLDSAAGIMSHRGLREWSSYRLESSDISAADAVTTSRSVFSSKAIENDLGIRSYVPYLLLSQAFC